MSSINNPAQAKLIATGSYTGDDTDNRQIITGFKCSMVSCVSVATMNHRVAFPLVAFRPDGRAAETDCVLHATDGFEVDAASMNAATYTYYYWAISE